ncbi:MAG: N-6 DNA methylase [Faecousia sp.]
MAKVVRNLREGQSEFQKVFSKLCDTKSSWQAWSDFVEMAAIAISNTCEIHENVKQDRDARYLTIIGQYSKSEQALFPELMRILTESLEQNQEQDFLGEMFMALELGNHWKGQFFTPYNLCKAMCLLSLSDAKEQLQVKGWLSLNDPACGAGATLIAARNYLNSVGIDGTQAFFVAQDIDRTAAMMCYIQLSLLGCAGYVVIADTLCHPFTGPILWPNITEHHDVWFMPMNFLEPAWELRMSQTWRGIDVENTSVCHKKETTEKAYENVDQLPTNCQQLKIQKLQENTAGEQLRLF